MSRERKLPTATPIQKPYQFRNVRGEPSMVEVLICSRWFKLSRNFFNQTFVRDSKRP